MSPLIRLNFGPSEAPNEVTWARGRLPDRTYIHATFTLDLPASQDYGQPARYVVKVFDEPNPPLDEKQYPEAYSAILSGGSSPQLNRGLTRSTGAS